MVSRRLWKVGLQRTWGFFARTSLVGGGGDLRPKRCHHEHSSVARRTLDVRRQASHRGLR